MGLDCLRTTFFAVSDPNFPSGSRIMPVFGADCIQTTFFTAPDPNFPGFMGSGEPLFSVRIQSAQIATVFAPKSG